MANIRVASVISPWLSSCRVGEVYSVPVSHGEGKIVAPKEELLKMKKGGQIATAQAPILSAPEIRCKCLLQVRRDGLTARIFYPKLRDY